MTMNETLLEDNNRYTLFPIKHMDMWNAYNNHKNAFWTAQEIDYTADIGDWENLSADEKFFIENILAFFAGSDGIVLENLIEDFSSQVKVPEARCFYGFQAMIENIHGETYSLLIDTFVKDPKRKTELFEAIDTIPAVGKKAKWALKWINKDIPFATRLIAFAIVEGVFFSGSFCSIFWLKNKGKMIKALGMANDFIARDEGLHTNFAVLLYKDHIVNKMTQDDFYEIMKEAVEIEREFICDSLPCNLIGMNSTLMYQYIKFVADRLSQQLGYDKIYNVDNPFPFMETIGLDGMGNFFEGRVSEYTSASSVIKQEDKHFILSDDF